MTEEAVAYRYSNVSHLARQIVDRLVHHLVGEGFPVAEIDIKAPDTARYRLEKDPSNGEYSLVGDWIDEAGRKQGGLVFHSDGSFFVEHDVIKPHPRKSKWFVEAVNAWGRGANIKAETRLLPFPE